MRTLFFAVILLASFTACQKEQGPEGPIGPIGPAGPQGPVGPQGPQGVAGNANVMQYTYGSQNFTTGFKTLLAPTTLDTMEKSAWFTYLFYAPLARWYFIPGYAFGAATSYRISMAHVGGKVNLFIDREGVGETYANAKVIRVLINNTMAGGRATETSGLPDIDFTNYEAVRKYYNLPD